MDYEDAQLIIEKQGHKVRGGTGIVSTHSPFSKKLKNRTWLHADKEKFYHLDYFNKNIIEFHPKYMRLNDHGYFSSSTMQRFNEYMPRGFHMRGATYPAFKLKRPLGFITTPKGTFPYSMPCLYTYEGTQLDHGGMYDDVRQALIKLPQYVDTYLDELFSGKPSAVDDEATAKRGFEPVFVLGGTREIDACRASRLMGVSIAQASTYKYFAVLAAKDNPKTIEGVELSYAIRLLIQYGSELFSTKTKAGRMEATLLAGIVPTINKQQLRKAIRQVCIEYAVNLLGFQEVQWNRRER